MEYSAPSHSLYFCSSWRTSHLLADPSVREQLIPVGLGTSPVWLVFNHPVLFPRAPWEWELSDRFHPKLSMKCTHPSGLQGRPAHKPGDCGGKSGSLRCSGTPRVRTPPSWLLWGCWGFTSLKSRLQLWPSASFLEGGVVGRWWKSPSEFPPPFSSPFLLCLVGAEPAFPFFFFARNRRLFLIHRKEQWQVNDVKLDTMLLRQDGDLASLWHGKAWPEMNEEFLECGWWTFFRISQVL